MLLKLSQNHWHPTVEWMCVRIIAHLRALMLKKVTVKSQTIKTLIEVSCLFLRINNVVSGLTKIKKKEVEELDSSH